MSQNNIRYTLISNDNQSATNIVVGDPLAPVTICGHYDIVHGSCGANDNGSSCAVMLTLILNKALNDNICFVFLDREETGMLGSSMHFSAYRPDLTINLDVVGGGDNIVFHTPASNRGSWWYDQLAELTKSYGTIPSKIIPCCDTHVIQGAGLDVCTFSAFPASDIKETKRRGYLCSSAVMAYMHCRRFDDIRYVNPNMLNLMVDMLQEYCKEVSQLEETIDFEI